MKYNATVISVDGKSAVVRYKLNPSCGGWSARKLSQAETLRNVSADNEIGAAVGDKVVIHMPDMLDIFLSAKEQVLPMIVGFIVMLMVNSAFNEQLLAYGSLISFFVQLAAFLIAAYLARAAFRKLADNNKPKTKQAIKILEVVAGQDDSLN